MKKAAELEAVAAKEETEAIEAERLAVARAAAVKKREEEEAKERAEAEEAAKLAAVAEARAKEAEEMEAKEQAEAAEAAAKVKALQEKFARANASEKKELEEAIAAEKLAAREQAEAAEARKAELAQKIEMERAAAVWPVLLCFRRHFAGCAWNTLHVGTLNSLGGCCRSKRVRKSRRARRRSCDVARNRKPSRRSSGWRRRRPNLKRLWRTLRGTSLSGRHQHTASLSARLSSGS
eukprot:SAG11_NODE_6846_length_1237_cov_0.982425_2_plen_236_part_00